METNGHCILLNDGEECVCPQLISYSLRCKWFRIAVLSGDKLLYAEIYQTEDRKKCTECGAFFASKSNNVKYCRKCITNRQPAERMRKRRAPFPYRNICYLLEIMESIRPYFNASSALIKLSLSVSFSISLIVRPVFSDNIRFNLCLLFCI